MRLVWEGENAVLLRVGADGLAEGSALVVEGSDGVEFRASRAPGDAAFAVPVAVLEEPGRRFALDAPDAGRIPLTGPVNDVRKGRLRAAARARAAAQAELEARREGFQRAHAALGRALRKEGAGARRLAQVAAGRRGRDAQAAEAQLERRAERRTAAEAEAAEARIQLEDAIADLRLRLEREAKLWAPVSPIGLPPATWTQLTGRTAAVAALAEAEEALGPGRRRAGPPEPTTSGAGDQRRRTDGALPRACSGPPRHATAPRGSSTSSAPSSSAATTTCAGWT